MTEATARPGAIELIAATMDQGSWRGWHEGGVVSPGDPAYQAALARARERTGLDMAVVTGEGRLHGRRVAVIACEFGFLAGTIGVAEGERLVRAVERATAERLPLIAFPASGGTRMQEGTVAFLQMVKVAAAIADHKAGGLPYLVYLRHPTTGGVLSSWGSLGHVTMAEPGALIGFLGPRVYEALYGEPFPPGVQVAENLHAKGLIDAVVPAGEVGEMAARALAVLCAAASPASVSVPATSRAGSAEPHEAVRREGAPDTVESHKAAGGAEVPAAESIRRSRRPDRPGVRELLRTAATDVTPLSGTAAGERDPGLLLALARFGAAPCVVLGQDRDRQRGHQPLGPAGLREAQRGMRLAAELGLPLVSVVDTEGAALSQAAEEGGLAGEIARCLAELVRLGAPTICLLLGEGTGGAALALLPADRVIAARHAWLSPLPPEGASAILYRTTDRAAEIAQAQGVRAADLLAAGIVDRIVEERPDAADEPDAFLRRVGAALEDELAALLVQDSAERSAARRRRYRVL
jgi:acetyl-CoA carboxylase carboxyl transferase subunit beta